MVIDTAPILPCPDYRLLEKSVDGTILVVAADRSGLLSWIAGSLALAGLSIQAAQASALLRRGRP